MEFVCHSKHTAETVVHDLMGWHWTDFLYWNLVGERVVGVFFHSFGRRFFLRLSTVCGFASASFSGQVVGCVELGGESLHGILSQSHFIRVVIVWFAAKRISCPFLSVFACDLCRGR